MFFFIAVLIVLFYESNRNNSIVIGFSAQLTGRQAELGVQERNGAQLAVEKVNATGGIAGRKISLSIRDDLGIPEKAQYVDNELIKEGVVAIIGHATSSQTKEGLKVTNPAKIVMIAPTVSAPELSDLDDYFFRVYPSFKNSTQAFAEYIHEKVGMDSIAVIYDNDNLIYSKNYSSIFADKFESFGGKITGEVSFSSEAKPNFSSLLSNLQEEKPEALLIVASDIDTALIAQRVRLMDWKVPMFTSAWAQTGTLINNGGHAVEGMILEEAYALNSKKQDFIDFQTSYIARFGNEPSFGSAYSYEAAQVLIDALKRNNGKKFGLKNALLQSHSFNGVVDTFSFNSYGDVERPFYLSTIRDGKFVTIGKLNFTNYQEVRK